MKIIKDDLLHSFFCCSTNAPLQVCSSRTLTSVNYLGMFNIDAHLWIAGCASLYLGTKVYYSEVVLASCFFFL